jgi:Ser/Thr protein kinase RdoA (MazF antagonist)
MCHLVDDNMRVIAPFMAHREADLGLVHKIAETCKDRISQWLPKSKPEYGICHGDLHGGDVCYGKNNKPMLFDFDSSGCGWRALDIGVFLASDDWMGITRKAENKRQRQLSVFLDGYSSIRSLTAHELSAVQLTPPDSSYFPDGACASLYGCVRG